jgi:ectoine hydroxylase-related dioxygenase (phytanoyl-CoA dioxygenase family)
MFLPSEKEVNEYLRNGYYVSREELISNEELAYLDEGLDEHYKGKRDRHLPAKLKNYLDWQPGDGDGLRINDYIVYLNNKVSKILENPYIGAIAAELSRTEEIRLFNSSAVYKPSSGDLEKGTVGWHTDFAYWQTCTSTKMLTAWIPLQDCNEKHGSISFIKGSHDWSGGKELEDLQMEKNFICKDIDGLKEKINSLGFSVKVVPIKIKRGQVCFHHCKVFHGSGPNTLPTPRRAVILHLQDRHNSYKDAFDRSGNRIVYNNDLMVQKDENGKPDYSDSFFCPVMYKSM